MPIKSTTTTERGRKEKKKSKKIYRTSQNIRIINVFLESLLLESFPSLGVTVHLTSLGCPPTLYWYLDLLWGQLTFLSGLTPMCSCFQCLQQSELAHILLWELSVTFYIFHRQRLPNWLCGFNLLLVQVVGRFGAFFLSHTALGFNCGFISTSAWGLSTGDCSWGCPGGLGFATVRARCGSGAAAWITGVLAAPGIQGSWWLGKHSALEGYGNQYWPIHASVLAWGTPTPWQRSLAGHRLQSHKESSTTEVILPA